MSQYDLNVKIIQPTQNKFAICMLVYPGATDPKWNYLFGACMISRQLKTVEWFRTECDINILTPVIDDPDILNIINHNFTKHITYTNTIELKNHSFVIEKKWCGVFNKLYFWKQSTFNYERILILDTDIFIVRPSAYKKLFNFQSPVAGCYENGYVHANNDFDFKKMGELVPAKYTYYIYSDGISYYNMINAGVMSIIPNDDVFTDMVSDLDAGWKHIEAKHPALRHKKGTNIYPEQEFLTGYFTGLWSNIPMIDFSSVSKTKNHYSSFKIKYWDRPPTAKTYRKIVIDAMTRYLANEVPKKVFQNIINNLHPRNLSRMEQIEEGQIIVKKPKQQMPQRTQNVTKGHIVKIK